MRISNQFFNTYGLNAGRNPSALGSGRFASNGNALDRSINANAGSFGQAGMSQMFMMLMQVLMQIMGSRLGSMNDAESTAYNPPAPPPYDPPAPPPYDPPAPPPYCPPPTTPKVLGSAGLFGDPKMGLFTPNIGNVPTALKSFESNLKPGQTVTLLNDPSLGGLKVSGSVVQVNPANSQSTAIGSAAFTSGNDTVTISGDGSLKVNNNVVANLNDAGNLAPIQLANGMTVSTSQQIDGANGQMAKRFVISNGEYKITAAARKPDGVTTPYLDMNFEELTPDAADNATGYQTSVPGMTGQFGLADLLRIEPNTFA